jgi:tetratricopeptide (TPR) repeat protein
VKYWQAATYLIKKNPVYGHGIESYRNLVYEAQAKVGQEDPEYWSNYEVPKPRHVHNQYLEILVDGGIVCAGILVWFLCFYLRPAWRLIRECTGEKRLILGTAFFSIIAVLVSMLFYFPLKEPTSLCMIGLMIGVMGGFSDVTDKLPVTPESPMLTRLAVTALAVIIISHVAIRPLIADHYSLKAVEASIEKDADLATLNVLKAIRYSPNSSEYWQHLGLVMLIMKRDPGAAKDFFERALLPYNGNIVQWSPHYFIGLSNLMMNRTTEAVPGLEMALFYYPAHPEAKQLMGKIKQRLANLGEEKP